MKRKPKAPTVRTAGPPVLGLSPRGAIATRFGGGSDELLAKLRRGAARFDLGDHGVHLAEEVLGCDPYLAGRDRDAIAIALLVTQVAARQGSTRVCLGGAMLELVTAVLTAAGSDLAPAAVTADIVRLTGQSGLGALIGGPGQLRPLVLDHGCLYQHRLWWLESQLAARLAARLASSDCPERSASAEREREVEGLSAAIAAVLAHPAKVTPTAQQVAAVRTALGGRLGVISGGPGTGKTTIIVSLVRALARLGEPGGIAVAAPTGKAAARVTEGIAAALAGISAPDAIDAALIAAPPAGQTLHRLLGWRPDGGFRHSELSPLPHAAVVVDEASMVDLALMERLARAVRPGARLILLGDAHQLPSVDAGAVLAELVGLARADGAPWAIELTESHRMREDDPDGRAILEAARAIDAGVAQRLGANRVSVDTATRQGVELVRVETPTQLGGAVDAWARFAEDGLEPLASRAYHHAGDAWRADDAEALRALLAHHERQRLLTVTRGLDTGAVAINARIHARMLASLHLDHAPDFVPGEPVLISANDYERGLYNGDQGVIARVIDADGAQRWRAIFDRRSGRGGLIALPIDAIRSSLELAWAMTVHKSQGSELDRIALVLPREDQPLCTRELLYTAVTRARRGVLILGTSEILEAAVARTSARDSGLAARLREAAR